MAFFVGKSYAQHHYPFKNDLQLSSPEKFLIEGNHHSNLSLKPFYKKHFNEMFNYDSLQYASYSIKTDTNKPWFNRKLLWENFINVKQNNFSLTIDPLLILTLGKEKNNSLYKFRNTRGIKLEGSLGKKITFGSEFYENQARFPDYLTTNINSTIVVPGQGVKRNFGNNSFDFNWAEGQLAYYPTKNITLEFGHGKHFIGNGYRSLFLSDNSFNYPYLKGIYATNNFFYTKIVMSLMHDVFDVNRSNVIYDRKTANIHYFGFFLGDNIQLSFFESNIWASPDTTGKQNFTFKYINPIPFLNTVIDENSRITNENNASIGFNFSINVFNSVMIYHQTLLDNIRIQNPDAFKQYGFQIGTKYYDAFSIDNFNIQSELNIVYPYTYAKVNTEYNYTHYNQALAHPLGANFVEGIFIANYQYKRFGLNCKFINSHYGDDQDSNYGKNIFKPLNTHTVETTESKLFQGFKTKLMHSEFYLSYILNPKTNLRFKAGVLSRKLTNDLKSDDTIYLYFSLETALKNFYYDF